MGTRIFRKVEETWVGAGDFFLLALLCFATFCLGSWRAKGNRQNEQRVGVRRVVSAEGAANKLLDDAAAGLQRVWHMDLATTREEEQLARVQMCTGTERREGIVKAVSSRIKARRGKVALARKKSEEAMQAAREFAKFAYHVAGGIDAFMLTLATYSAGAHGGNYNARCLNDDAEGTTAEKYQAGPVVEKARKSQRHARPHRRMQERAASNKTVGQAEHAIEQTGFVTPFDSTEEVSGIAPGHAGQADEGCALLAGHARSANNQALFQTASGSFPFAVYGGIWTVQSPGTTTMASSCKSHKNRKREAQDRHDQSGKGTHQNARHSR
ncbi:putative Trypanosome variant surface glycoprotein (A type) [Trypanosoma vivax]|nr:putative Trypanosome variant surface glycoprotein (A type) [Trypanosoma vivax]